MFSAQRIVLTVGSLLCLAIFLHLYRQSNSFPQGHPIHHATPKLSQPNYKNRLNNGSLTPPLDETDDDPCAGLEGLDDIVIVLKTGASEIYRKLPIHFATTFACEPDFLIYSDVEQNFGPVKVHDALGMVSEEMKGGSDFAEYRDLLRHVGKGGDASQFKGKKGWELDKFKFLPMISDTYDRYGDEKKWFVFIEADTYLSTHNLMLWLRELDPASAIFGGAQVLIGGTEFAHGGSGFIMSVPAAKAVTEGYRADPWTWEQKLSQECCGDKILGDVLRAHDPPIGVLRAFPTIQGETPDSLDWSPVHWCMPAVSWHHADAAAVDKLWNFERQWKLHNGVEEPILFRDYYDAFVQPRLKAADWKMTAWDNLSNDWTYTPEAVADNFVKSVVDAEVCEATCRDKPTCVQWAFRPGVCRGDKVVRLGWALDARPELGSADDRVVKEGGDGDDQAVSGWFEDRIEEYKKRFEPCGDRSFWITRNKNP